MDMFAQGYMDAKRRLRGIKPTRAASIDLDCPARVETSLTGFRGAASRYLRGHRLRCEWYAGRPAMLAIDGVPVTLQAEMSAERRKAFHRLMHDSFTIFCQ